MIPLNEIDLCWLNVRNGDRDAFAVIYKYYWRPLYSSAYRLLQDKSAAADLVQELFIKLWEKHAGLPEVNNIEGYLFTWLRGLVLNYLRSYRIREKHLEAFEHLILRTDETLLNNINEKDARSQVLESIDKLPEKMREVFYMSRIEHLPVADIAHKLNISEQTVRNHISTAVKRIRPAIKTAILLFYLS